MIAHDKTNNLGLQTLANHFKISASYLSKILTQLVKANLIQSTPGVNGGYVLSKKKEDISFMDVIKAIEGTGALFNCELHEEEGKCRILKVMAEAENMMETYLQNKKVYELVQNTTTN